MENNAINQRNVELFTALKKYSKDSKEYRDIVSAIVKNNIGLVISTAEEYFPIIKFSKISNNDLISEGYWSMLNAIKLFKLEKGAFSTYAVKSIKNNIIRFLIRERKHQMPSLEDNNEDGQKLADDLIIPVDFEEDFIEKDETDRRLSWVRKNVKQLPSSQKRFLSAKYLSGETELPTDKKIAEKFKRTEQNISATNRRAFKRLRKMYYKAHPDEIVAEQEVIELTSEEKTKMKETLKSLILAELPPLSKEVMLCKFYSDIQKTNQQVAEEVNSTEKCVSSTISNSYRKLYNICDSIKDKKHLKNILEFRAESSEKER